VQVAVETDVSSKLLLIEIDSPDVRSGGRPEDSGGQTVRVRAVESHAVQRRKSVRRLTGVENIGRTTDTCCWVNRGPERTNPCRVRRRTAASRGSGGSSAFSSFSKSRHKSPSERP